MPQIKKEQPLYGLKYAAYPVVAQFHRKNGILFTDDEIALLIRVAIKPYAFISRASSGPVAAFFRLYAKRPDAVLNLVTVIRKTLAKEGKTKSGKVRHFLLTHATVTHHKGQLVAVQSLTDDEIAVFLLDPKDPHATEIVKRERKNLRRKLEAQAFWEKPDIATFMQTGRFPQSSKPR